MSLADPTLALDPDLDSNAVARLRFATPGADGLTFLNSAGSSLPSRAVIQAHVGHLALEAQVGGYRAAEQAAPLLADTRAAAAELIGAQVDEVALVASATDAWRTAFYGQLFEPGDTILTARATYGSNAIAMLQVARRTGARMEVIPDAADGLVALDWLSDRLKRGDVKLIALTHIPTGEGIVNPAEAVGRLAGAAGVLYLLDACQSVGQRVLNVDALGCDMLTATGRKYLRGPRGTGFLYVRRSVQDRFEPPMLDNVSAVWATDNTFTLAAGARRYEQFEYAVAARIGLGIAIRELLVLGQAPVQRRIVALAQSLRDQLSATPGVTVHDRGVERCGLVTWTVADMPASAVKLALREHKVDTSVCDVESYRLGMAHRGLTAVVRASPHAFNTAAEIARCAAVVAKIS